MYAAGVIRPEGVNQIAQFPLWITAAVLNVIMQELLVRGYLYQLLRQAHGAAVAVAASTALFTLLHGGALAAGPVPVLNVLTMSLLMTAVLEYTGSLVAPTAMHAVWNGVGALVLYHTEDRTPLETRAERYGREGRQYYSGRLYVPRDLETIEL